MGKEEMKDIELRKITRAEVTDLWDKYFYSDGYKFLEDYPHHLDKQSSKVLYSVIRHYKPQVCLEFGVFSGGSACIILTACGQNGLPFRYIPFEKNPDYSKDAKQNILRECKIDIEIFGDITKNLDKIPESLDFVFIDPEWDKEIAVWTYENIIPRVKKGGLVAIHDWSVSEELQYQGGQFEGIKYFIELTKEGKMPLFKIFSMWDHEEFRPNYALSFWVKI